VTAGDDLVIRAWDAHTLKRLADVGKQYAPVTRLAFRRDGAQLASAAADGQIRVWDTATGDAIASFSGGQDEICSLAFSPDGTMLFWGEGPRVRWTCLGSSASAGVFDTGDTVHVLRFAPDGRTLVCGGGQGKLLVCNWDGNDVARRAVLTHQAAVAQHEASLPINRAAYSPNGRLIATAASDHRVRIWDAHRLVLQKEWDLRCPVVAVGFSPDGRYVISGNGNSTLTVFRIGW
jgi:WD40 repeat protein